jgi:hypothetical protein
MKEALVSPGCTREVITMAFFFLWSVKYWFIYGVIYWWSFVDSTLLEVLI